MYKFDATLAEFPNPKDWEFTSCEEEGTLLFSYKHNSDYDDDTGFDFGDLVTEDYPQEFYLEDGADYDEFVMFLKKTGFKQTDDMKQLC